MKEATIAVLLEELRIIKTQLQQLTTTCNSDEILDSADMKILFKISDKTLYRWRKRNDIPSVKIGNKYFYTKQQVLALLNTRMQQSSSAILTKITTE